MILTRLQLKLFIEKLTETPDYEGKAAEILNFITAVLTAYHLDTDQVMAVEALNLKSKGEWSLYQRIQEHISLLEKLQQTDEVKLRRAFKTAFEQKYSGLVLQESKAKVKPPLVEITPEREPVSSDPALMLISQNSKGKEKSNRSDTEVIPEGENANPGPINPLIPQNTEDNEQGDKKDYAKIYLKSGQLNANPATLEEFTNELSFLLAGGIIERLTVKYNDVDDIDSIWGFSQSTVGRIKTTLSKANLSDFILNSINLILRQEEKNKFEDEQVEADINDEGGPVDQQPDNKVCEDRVKRDELINDFKLAVNQAIVLQSKQMNGREMSEFSRFNLTRAMNVIDIDFQFYVKEKLTSVIKDFKEATFFSEDRCDWINLLKYIREVIDSSNQNPNTETLRNLCQEILHYYTPNAATTRFRNLKLLVTLNDDNDDEEVDLVTYENLIAELNSDFHRRLTSVAQKATADLQSYLKKRVSLGNKLRDWYLGYTDSDSSSYNGRRTTAERLKGALNTFISEQEAVDSISDLGAILQACNFSLFGKTPTSGNKYNSKYAVETAGAIDFTKSDLGIAIWGIIENTRTKIAAPYSQELLCSLGASRDPSITKHDLYFELNLVKNFTFKIESEDKLKKGWFSRITSALFSEDQVQKNRENYLKRLTTLLVRCDTEQKYINLLYAIFLSYTEANSPDMKQFKNKNYTQALQGLFLNIVQYHLLTAETFHLDFSSKQLKFTNEMLTGMDLQKHTVQTELNKKIVIVSTAEQANCSLKLESSPEQVAIKKSKHLSNKQSLSRETAAKEAFKEVLTAKLQSNTMADIISSTGDFVKKSKDIGLASKVIGMVTSHIELPGCSAVGGAIEAGGEILDEHLQLKDAQKINDQISSRGGWILWWKTVVKVLLKKIDHMFGEHIASMSEEDAKRFAEFCFVRIYDALKNPKKENFKQLSNLEMDDFLLGSIFLSSKKLSKVWHKDHYHLHDEHQNFFKPSKRTFQGLVNNAAFRPDKESSQGQEGVGNSNISGGEVEAEGEEISEGKEFQSTYVYVATVAKHKSPTKTTKYKPLALSEELESLDFAQKLQRSTMAYDPNSKQVKCDNVTEDAGGYQALFVR